MLLVPYIRKDVNVVISTDAQLDDVILDGNLYLSQIDTIEESRIEEDGFDSAVGLDLFDIAPDGTISFTATALGFSDSQWNTAKYGIRLNGVSTTESLIARFISTTSEVVGVELDAENLGRALPCRAAAEEREAAPASRPRLGRAQGLPRGTAKTAHRVSAQDLLRQWRVLASPA